jgi:hypothetical protein
LQAAAAVLGAEVLARQALEVLVAAAGQIQHLAERQEPLVKVLQGVPLPERWRLITHLEEVEEQAPLVKVPRPVLPLEETGAQVLPVQFLELLLRMQEVEALPL